ncbi:MAG: hypothetical protein KME47_10035 [Nodosilinea sp. WJT8-NPBG4]|nr:hypothetical protein [Nodosilinea sp. WJT8-NPBG4]
MKQSTALSLIAVVSFTAGVGFTVVERFAYRESNLNRLRNNTDLVEIQPGIFCTKTAANDLPKELLLKGGFCNSYFSNVSYWLVP